MSMDTTEIIPTADAFGRPAVARKLGAGTACSRERWEAGDSRMYMHPSDVFWFQRNGYAERKRPARFNGCQLVYVNDRGPWTGGMAARSILAA